MENLQRKISITKIAEKLGEFIRDENSILQGLSDYETKLLKKAIRNIDVLDNVIRGYFYTANNPMDSDWTQPHMPPEINEDPLIKGLVEEKCRLCVQRYNDLFVEEGRSTCIIEVIDLEDGPAIWMSLSGKPVDYEVIAKQKKGFKRLEQELKGGLL